MLQVLSVKECHLSGPRKRAFSATFWNIIPSEFELALTLLAFHKAFKGFVLEPRASDSIRTLMSWLVRVVASLFGCYFYIIFVVCNLLFL